MREEVSRLNIWTGYTKEFCCTIVYDHKEQCICCQYMLVDRRGLEIDIQVDGGITSENAQQVIHAGANVLVAGSSGYTHLNAEFQRLARRD